MEMEGLSGDAVEPVRVGFLTRVITAAAPIPAAAATTHFTQSRFFLSFGAGAGSKRCCGAIIEPVDEEAPATTTLSAET